MLGANRAAGASEGAIGWKGRDIYSEVLMWM